jgi:uncharacterized protein (DUF362 family)
MLPMDAVSREFEEHLTALRRRCEGKPGEEIRNLLLLALEREQMVSISYREELITERLRRTPLAPSLQDLIRHALIWVWKDEEMHAVYLRGLLLKTGTWPLKVLSFVQQVNGTFGGWASSIRMHVPWSKAPFLRAAATVLQWMGVIAGKVPREVRRELDYRPFREFCAFNVDAERTASLCWARIIELGAASPDYPRDVVEEFRRMKTDEDQHVRVFDAVARALDPDDRLAPGETEAGLADRLRALGDEFLPRSFRGVPATVNPLGTGGRVVTASGADKAAVFRRALEDAGLPRVLARRPPGYRAAIKATFMMGYHRRDRSPFVDPELADLLARFLREHGAADVALLEAPNIYDRFYRNRSVEDVARYLGFTSASYRVVDLSRDQAPHRFGRGMAQSSVGRAWKDADVRIAFGKLKTHPVDYFTLSLSALEGLGIRNDQFLFAERQAHRSTAIMTLLSDFAPHFAIVDGYEHVPDGVLGMMGAIHAKSPRRIYAGEDAVAVDLVAAGDLGTGDPRACSMVRDACYWFGDPESRIERSEPRNPIRGWRGPYDSELSSLLSSVSYPFYTFFTGRGSTFVPEMDETAFPPVGGESLCLRLTRRALQTLLILRHQR